MRLHSHAVINLYFSYENYRALKQDVSNLELVARLITWLVATVYVTVCNLVLDPLFSMWLPMYHFAKVGIALWLIHPSTMGGYLLFVTQISPWINQTLHELSEATLPSPIAAAQRSAGSDQPVLERRSRRPLQR